MSPNEHSRVSMDVQEVGSQVVLSISGWSFEMNCSIVMSCHKHRGFHVGISVGIS